MAQLSEKKEREIARMYDDGKPTQAIAEHFNISTASVSYYAKKHGCTMRKGK